MGRGRGKGKKQSVVAARDDTASGEDEKMPMRRRGRPQKPLKDDIEDGDKVMKIDEQVDNVEETKTSILSKSSATENGRKRKRNEKAEENGVGTKTNATDLIKAVGYRQNGSRRKNKPRRAAEVGVEFK